MANNYIIVSDAKRIIGKKYVQYILSSCFLFAFRLYDKDVTKVRGVFAHSLVADTSGATVIQIPQGDDKGTYSNIYPQVVFSDPPPFIFIFIL